MKKTAKFVRYLPVHLQGSLYEVSHKIKVNSETTNFINVITVEVDKISKEKITLAYAADSKMRFLSSTPLPMSQVEGKDQMACLNKIGFEIINEK